MQEYRGYIIDFDSFQYEKRFTYQYYHEEYDGPEDDRFGYGETIEECKEKIDEYIDDDPNSILVCAEDGCGANEELIHGDEVSYCPACRTVEGATKYMSDWELENA